MQGGNDVKNLLLLSLVLISLVLTSCSGKLTEVSNKDVGSKTADPDPEIETAMNLIKKAPDSAIGYNQLTVIYIKKARHTSNFELNKEAEAANKKALELEPNDPWAKKLQASLSLTFHRFANGLELANRLLKEFPDDPFVYGVLADANTELGNYPEAVAAAQKMVDLRPNSSSYARVAHLRSLHGDHPGAAEMYKIAAKTADPADREAQSWCLVQLGKEYWNNGKYKEAGKVFDEALGLIPDYRLALIAKARNLAALGNFDEAERVLTGFDGYQSDPDVHILLAQIYERKGDLQKADEFFRKGLELETKNLGVASEQQHVALLWANYDINLPQALQIAEEEYSRQKDIYTADLLAWCLFKTGRFAEASKMSEKAMSLKTNDARLFYHAGMIENALGNRARARALLEKALKLNPGFDLKQADLARATLEKLRG